MLNWVDLQAEFFLDIVEPIYNSCAGVLLSQTCNHPHTVSPSCLVLDVVLFQTKFSNLLSTFSIVYPISFSCSIYLKCSHLHQNMFFIPSQETFIAPHSIHPCQPFHRFLQPQNSQQIPNPSLIKQLYPTHFYLLHLLLFLFYLIHQSNKKLLAQLVHREPLKHQIQQWHPGFTRFPHHWSFTRRCV